LSRLLAEAEERWEIRESERLFTAERAWQAAENERLAAHDARWNAKMAQIFSGLASRGIKIPADLLEAQASLTGGFPPAPSPLQTLLPPVVRQPRQMPEFVREWRWTAAFMFAAFMTALLSF